MHRHYTKSQFMPLVRDWILRCGSAITHLAAHPNYTDKNYLSLAKIYKLTEVQMDQMANTTLTHLKIWRRAICSLPAFFESQSLMPSPHFGSDVIAIGYFYIPCCISILLYGMLFSNNLVNAPAYAEVDSDEYGRKWQMVQAKSKPMSRTRPRCW